MGKRSIPSGLLGWIGFIVLFLVVNAIDNHKYQKALQSIDSKTIVPPPDPNRTPIFYSNMKGVWVYKESVGAKASRDALEPNYNSEDDIEKYLQKHIPAYRKKTYWGEEIDIPDIIWDDEGDDYELDPDHRIK